MSDCPNCAALLERLQKAERALDDMGRLHQGLMDTARAKALEDAAKVAEECDWLAGPPEGKSSSLRETIAAAIRAKKGDRT